MSLLHTMFSYVHAWFGYVSWCMSASGLACKPFLAFVALLGASGGTLVLLCLALSTLLNDLAWQLDERRREQRGVRKAMAVAENIRAPEMSSRAPPQERVEPVFAPAALAMSMAEPVWPEAGAAGTTLKSPSPPAL